MDKGLVWLATRIAGILSLVPRGGRLFPRKKDGTVVVVAICRHERYRTKANLPQHQVDAAERRPPEVSRVVVQGTRGVEMQQRLTARLTVVCFDQGTLSSESGKMLEGE